MACLAVDNVTAMFPNVHFGIFIVVVWICSAGDFPRGKMPPRKRQKLAAVSGTHGVTDAALLEILKVLRACPSILDDVYSRRTIERAAHDFLDEVGTVLGSRVPVFIKRRGCVSNSTPLAEMVAAHLALRHVLMPAIGL